MPLSLVETHARISTSTKAIVTFVVEHLIKTGPCCALIMQAKNALQLAVPNLATGKTKSTHFCVTLLLQRVNEANKKALQRMLVWPHANKASQEALRLTVA